MGSCVNLMKREEEYQQSYSMEVRKLSTFRGEKVEGGEKRERGGERQAQVRPGALWAEGRSLDFTQGHWGATGGF